MAHESLMIFLKDLWRPKIIKTSGDGEVIQVVETWEILWNSSKREERSRREQTKIVTLFHKRYFFLWKLNIIFIMSNIFIGEVNTFSVRLYPKITNKSLKKIENPKLRRLDGLPGRFWLKFERRTRCTHSICPKTTGNAFILTF